MNSPRHYLAILTAIFTVALMAWTVVEIIRHGGTFWTAAVLIYFVLVGVTLWVARGPASAEARTMAGQGEEESEKTVREIILKMIRKKGRAQRRDLLPVVRVSKSTLVRLLDKMEAEGLVVQTGERKGAYYTLKGPGS